MGKFFSFLKRRLLSFKYAINGFFYVIATQTNMKIHLTVALIVIGFGLYFKLTMVEWLFLVIAIFSVILAEMINTVVEEILDLLFPTYNKKVGIIKDISAGIVLIFSLMAVIIGLIIFIPKFIEILF